VNILCHVESSAGIVAAFDQHASRLAERGALHQSTSHAGIAELARIAGLMVIVGASARCSQPWTGRDPNYLGAISGGAGFDLRLRQGTAAAASPSPRSRRGRPPHLFLQGKPQDLVDRTGNLAALERFGQPEDIAAAVAFLASPINGQTLRATDGLI
jgi:hypothetical protein